MPSRPPFTATPRSTLTRPAAYPVLTALLLLAACGDDRRPGGVLPDDGGVPPGDAAPRVDGGPRTDGGPGPSPTGPVDPMCTDGRYTETLPDPNAPIDDVAFAGDVPAFVDTVLGRRYPFGLELVEGGRTNTSFGSDCSVLFAGSPASAADVYRAMSTITHECGHFWDGERSRGATNVYELATARTLTAMRGDTTSRGGDTFARSLIRLDSYQTMRPPCGGSFRRGCDSYADIYLDGNPADATFESGDQGFNLLFEETVQYVNSLATEYAFADRIRSGSSTSARDGILTFLWYVERYLRLARTEYPAAYARIADDAAWRDAILTVWGRAWLYLGLTAENPALGLEDDVLEGYVLDPVLLDEIDRLRALSGC